MSWKHWTVVGLVIGLGVLWQIPRHENATDDHPHATRTAAPADPGDTHAGPHRTIALEVAGMT